MHAPPPIQSKRSDQKLAGYYTESRKRNNQSRYSGKPSSAFTDPVSDYTNVSSNEQTTWSYRTGRAGSEDLDDVLTDLYNNKSSIYYDNFDTGHPFYTERKTFFLGNTSAYIKGINGSYYNGPLFPVWDSDPWPSVSGISGNEINLYGNQFIASAAPTAPVVNLAQSAAELIREGIPKLGFIRSLETRTHDIFSVSKGVGDDGLGLVFGWTPLLKDYTNIMKMVVSANDQISTYTKNSGGIVRRSRGKDPERTTTSKIIATNSPTNVGNIANWENLYEPGGQFGTVRKITEVSSRFWWKGAFTYYVPNGDSFAAKAERYSDLANHMLGLKLTPQTLWELAPWSWLADWFVDVQSAITTADYLSDPSKLVLRYSYLMKTTVATNTYDLSGIKFRLGPGGSITATFQVTRKERVKGTPFGFGVDLGSLNDYQKTIMALLGLSKAPGLVR